MTNTTTDAATAENAKNQEKNLAIWTQVMVTDEGAKKAIDGSNLTSINHNYQIKRATALFGPIGFGWGYKVIKAEVIEGALISADKPAVGVTKVSSVHIEFWYMHEKQKCTFEHFGQTTLVGKKSTGELYNDEDAHKKSLTDAIGKSLSMLGFSADIYGGETDNKTVIQTDLVSQEEDVKDPIVIKINACATMQALAEVWGTLTREEALKYQSVKEAKKVLLSTPS